MLTNLTKNTIILHSPLALKTSLAKKEKAGCLSTVQQKMRLVI